MTDPFVQRMMARNQARRNVLGKVVGESDKENVNKSLSNKTSQFTSIDVTADTTGSDHSKSHRTTNLDEINSEKIINDSKQVLQEHSNQTLVLHQHSPSPIPSHSVSDLRTHLPSNSSSTMKQPRFQHLAQRTKQLEEWEDDYTYHSISGGSAKEEAQGFTPSTSNSKLGYDFRNRSPVKETSRSQSPLDNEGSKDLSHRSSPRNVSKGQLDQRSQTDLPKVVSVRSKSNIYQENPEKEEMSKPFQDKERSQSPGKVSNLRSQWERHIRNASPERDAQRSMSPSPERKAHKNAFSTMRSRSPQKDNYSCTSSMNEVCATHVLSPSKCQPLHSDGRERSTTSQGFSRISGSRTSLHSISPHKPGQCGEVIKGEVTMPETTPIVKNPVASVRERAAAFSSLSGQLHSKDPAELSLQDRKSLFEKHKGTALMPKAPFGHCVSEKTLQSTDVIHKNTSKSYEVPKVPKFVPAPCNKTFVASQSSVDKASDEKSYSDFASSVVEAQKRRFEHLEDNWRETDINAKAINERKSEMQQLLNRFRKPRSNIKPQELPVAYQEVESDTEYPESEESTGEFEVFGQNLSAAPLGPPKPPRTGIFQGSPNKTLIPPPPPMPNSPRSPWKILNSTEIDESYPQSPSKEYVPKIKPGCLFPSLSDIDSHSEAVESDEENKNSSFAESILTCASADSLGARIQAMAQGVNKGPTRQLSTIREGTVKRRSSDDQSLSSSTQEALGAIDDALDEAFDEDDEPTPPKRGRNKGEEDAKNVYKTPKIYHESSSSSDSENLLAHSVSMYRKQKPAEVLVTPVRQIIRKPELCSPSKDSPGSPSMTISSRIRELQEEEEHQLTVISQASSAITVVSQHPEQHGTTQHIEAEKLLLVAIQKRQAALDEIQRLKAEGALGKRNYWTQDEDSCRGSISISKMTLPLKQDFLDKSRNENSVYHFLVLVKHRDQVITSQLQTTPDCVVEGAITFPNLMSLHDLTADFNISLEVYGFRVEHLHPAGFKKEHSRLKLTPLKRLQKECKSSFSPAVSSPVGPYSVRTSSFQLIGFSHLNINTLTRNAWTLEKVPFNSPMNGHLLMRVTVAMEGGVCERSFLTMFDDVGGFGAWNRRWCVLSGPFIRYWSYPDDENKKDFLGCLDMRMCTTRKAEQVTRDVCARQFTFQLTFLRPLRNVDKSDLIHEVRENTLITRILMSADSKEERILWCNKLNKALANVRAWDPDALKPEDFHV